MHTLLLAGNNYVGSTLTLVDFILLVLSYTKFSVYKSLLTNLFIKYIPKDNTREPLRIKESFLTDTKSSGPFSFQKQETIIWNSIPSHIRFLLFLNSFKNNLTIQLFIFALPLMPTERTSINYFLRFYLISIKIYLRLRILKYTFFNFYVLTK